MEKEYRKTYMPLVLWMLVYIVLCTVIPMLAGQIWPMSAKQEIWCIYLVTVVALELLMYMMHQGEYAYWITGGPSFEEAKKAGCEKRREYTGAHLKIFSVATVGELGYLIVSYLCDFSFWMDTIVICGGIAAAAFWTLRVKFDKMPCISHGSERDAQGHFNRHR